MGAAVVLEHMDRVGIAPDVTAFNYLTLAHAARGDAEMTYRLSQEIKVRVPVIAVVGLLCYEASHQLALRQARGIEPNVFTFINLVRACAVAGCPERALSIVDPSFPWDFYSAAITIFAQYGCFPEADALYAAAVEHRRAPQLVQSNQGGEVELLDLHGYSVPVASAAVRHTLKQLRRRWEDEGPAAVGDMVIISGQGKKSATAMSPVVRPLVQDLLIDQFDPPISSATKPGNPGRIVVSRESLLAWLHGDGSDSPVAFWAPLAVGDADTYLAAGPIPTLDEQLRSRAPSPTRRWRTNGGSIAQLTAGTP
jgi:hypothetical protein